MLKTLSLLVIGLALACLSISQFPNPGPPLRYSVAGEYQPVIIAGKSYRCFAIRDATKPDPVNDELVLVDEAGKIVPR